MDGADAGGEGFVDEYDPACENSKGAGAMKTSLWELAALQNHYLPAVSTLVRRRVLMGEWSAREGIVFFSFFGEVVGIGAVFVLCCGDGGGVVAGIHAPDISIYVYICMHIYLFT